MYFVIFVFSYTYYGSEIYLKLKLVFSRRGRRRRWREELPFVNDGPLNEGRWEEV